MFGGKFLVPHVQGQGSVFGGQADLVFCRSAVCEDAFTIKKQSDGETTTIKGGGAFGAEDKVLQ